MKRNWIKFLIHVVLPLVIGFFIYFFFRPHYLFIELFFGDRLPVIDKSHLNTFQQILIFSGPDACWSYSLSSALFIWASPKKGTNNFLPFLILLLIVVSELIQLTLAPGFYFTWPDLIAAVLGFGLSYLMVYRYEKN